MGCSGAKALETISEQRDKNKNNNNEKNIDNNNNDNDNNNGKIDQKNTIQNNHISEMRDILSLNNTLNITQTENTIFENRNINNRENNKEEDEISNENNFLNISNSDNNTLISSINNSFYDNETTTENINEMFNIKKESSNSNLTILNLTIYANRFEAMYPIWIEKDTEIKFNVNGKWKVDSKNECTSTGIESNEINTTINLNDEDNFNNGALIGRIFNDKPFVIYDNLTINSKVSGPLFLRMNVKNLFNKILPSGKLNIKIIGAKSVNSFEEIEEMIGWDKNLKDIEYNDSDKNFFVKLSFIDKETIIYLNKVRFNSNLFCIQYLNNIKNLTSATRILCDFMINQKKKIEKFKVNYVIMKLIENFYKPFFGRSNKLKNKKISILNSQKELEDYLNENFENKKKFKIFMKKHDCQKPLSLCIKFLVSEEIRNEIFNEENKEITLLTIRTRKRQKINYFSFLIFSNEEGNKGTNNLKKLLFYNPSYSNMNVTKSNLEIINEEKVKNNFGKIGGKKIKIIRGINKTNLKEPLGNHHNSISHNFNLIEKDEIDKIIYKSDDESNIHKNENDKYDEDEDDDE